MRKPNSNRQTINEGYEKFVIRNPEGCWDWKGCCPKNPGYGQFRSFRKIIKAHRASWIIHKGEIPEGMCVCHSCDNKRCSNPEHLFLGTCKDNNLDAHKKGILYKLPAKKRDENPLTKIKTTEFWKILKLLKLDFSAYFIASIFNVSLPTMLRVIRQAEAVPN